MDAPQSRDSDPFYVPFHTFQSHYLSLCETWTFFQILYQEPENVAILHEAAGLAFEQIGRSTVEHLLIQLARLSDPEVTAGHKNLSLDAIVVEVGKCLTEPDRKIPDPYPPQKTPPPRAVRDREFLAKIEAVSAKLRPIRQKLIQHRVKWIAHLDFEHAINPRQKVLADLSFAEIGQAIELVGLILVAINSYFWQVGVTYSMPPRSEKQLLSIVRLGSLAQKQLFKQRLPLDGDFPAFAAS
jgi:hypothetical protein